MKLRKVMASVCCMGLVAGLAGCGGSKEAPATEQLLQRQVRVRRPRKRQKTQLRQQMREEVPDRPGNRIMQQMARLVLHWTEFVQDVADKSGGSIEISLFTDGTLGSASDNYSSVASGDLDMTMSGLEGLDLYAPGTPSWTLRSFLRARSIRKLC